MSFCTRRHAAAATTTLLLVLSASAEAATSTLTFGWEDGSSTSLGSFTNGNNNYAAANVATGEEIDYGTTEAPQSTYTVTPFAGSRMLQMTEAPPAGTPQGYLAWVENLDAGDTVSYRFRAYDPTAARSPSVSSSGVYTPAGDINGFAGFATPQQPFSEGPGWVVLGTDVTFDPGTTGDRNGVLIRASLFAPSATPADGSYDFFVDALEVTVTSNNPAARVTLPDGSVTAVPEPGAAAAVALVVPALLSRRRRRA